MFDLTASHEFFDPQFALVPYALFCLAAGVSAMAVLHLDKALVDTDRPSILRITYDKPLWRMSLLWFRGAFIAALIGGALQIWKPSLYAAVVVGLTWQVLLTQFLETVRQSGEPIQPSAQSDEERVSPDE